MVTINLYPREWRPIHVCPIPYPRTNPIPPIWKNPHSCSDSSLRSSPRVILGIKIPWPDTVFYIHSPWNTPLSHENLPLKKNTLNMKDIPFTIPFTMKIQQLIPDHRSPGRDPREGIPGPDVPAATSSWHWPRASARNPRRSSPRWPGPRDSRSGALNQRYAAVKKKPEKPMLRWWLVWTPLKNMSSSIGMIRNPILMGK